MSVTGSTAQQGDFMRRLSQQQSDQVARVGASSTGTALSGSGASTDTSRLNQNFDMFLQLLTTQLRNQSPLDPMKTEEFSQQLTQYSGVEQQIKTNSMLERLIAAQSTGSTNAALGFLGNDVLANTGRAELRDGRAEWTVTSPAGGQGTATVTNANGAVVRTMPVTLRSGVNSIAWDGRDGDGVAQPAGGYTISVSARNSQEQEMQVSTQARGRVTAIDLSGPEPMLTVAGAQVKMSNIARVSVPTN